ncbi:MAG: hypothetical protein ACLRRU_03145 [Faecalibacterium sp.]
MRWLSECGSTNAYAKEHFEEFGPVGAVYTTNRTAGRGRLGRNWVNAEGRALYYTAVIRSRWPSLPPCRCWQACRPRSRWPSATAWTAG